MIHDEKLWCHLFLVADLPSGKMLVVLRNIGSLCFPPCKHKETHALVSQECSVKIVISIFYLFSYAVASDSTR